jgi:hypothetical protein
MHILCRFIQLATAFQEGKVTRYCLLFLPPLPKNGEHGKVDKCGRM